MTRVTRLAAAAGFVLATSTSALAVPIQIDFNVPGFAGPATGTQQTFVKNIVGLPTMTFEALDENLNAAGKLHWDANDGNGFGDGFGVRDFSNLHTGGGLPAVGSTYSQDEIEANERLRLTFSAPTLINSFNVTDFFYENEGNLTGLPVCVVNDPSCYREIGEYSLNGGLTWISFLSDPNQLRANQSNGILTVAVNDFATSVIFRSQGVLFVNGFPYGQLHDFSLAGVNIDRADIPETPEPATLALLGIGLAGLGAKRFRRKS